jgi:N-acetyl-anhydromuramyl-L-alanine amidase AmpD
MRDAGLAVDRLRNGLADIGYRLDRSGVFDDQAAACVRAFQRRWRPVNVTGEADAETLALIEAVADMAR